MALLLFGALEPLERALLEFRFETVRRPATEGLVLVEIDAKSLHELNIWPWPRAYHAQLIDRLLDAGAKQILFDVDFSARSTPADDQTLGRAIARADGRLILPTFVQGAQAFSPEPSYLNRPNPALQAGARLGMANVRPEADGRIWRYPVAEGPPGGYRPSLAVQLAGAGHYRVPDFLIDYGIRAETITRLSYVDVLRGRIDTAAIAGRDVLVGATAAELGDHLAVPIYRAVPGVLIHALAYQSVVQGRMIQRTGTIATALGVIVLLLVLAPFMGTDEGTWPKALGAGLVVSASIVAGTLVAQREAALSVDSAAWHATILFMFLASTLRRLHEQAILLFRQRMAQTHGRALMRSVVEDSFDGVLITDRTGRIELANRAALRILGRAASPVGLTLEAVVPELSRLPDPAVSGAADTAPKHEIDIRRDGARTVSLEVVVSVSELRVSRRRYERRKRARRLSIYTFRDVTDRQQMATAQRRALDAAVSANRAKSDFLANMSHELRTPLNAIIGFSEAILEGVFGPLGNARYRTYIQDIHGSGSHLLAIIQQVLDVSRIEAGTLTLNEAAVSLPETLSECEKIIRGWLMKTPRQLNLAPDPDLPPIYADPTILKQIVLNLLSNAVKFTDRNGVIDVRIHLDPEGCPTIDIIDNGVGIPEDKIGRIGQPFYQADASVSGTGLGLYLVKNFVTLHGGTLAFTSRPGQGTRVRVTFPRSRIVETGTPTGPSSRGAAGPAPGPLGLYRAAENAHPGDGGAAWA